MHSPFSHHLRHLTPFLPPSIPPSDVSPLSLFLCLAPFCLYFAICLYCCLHPNTPLLTCIHLLVVPSPLLALPTFSSLLHQSEEGVLTQSIICQFPLHRCCLIHCIPEFFTLIFTYFIHLFRSAKLASISCMLFKLFFLHMMYLESSRY